MSPTNGFLLTDRTQTEAVLEEMAARIAAEFDDDLVLVGILRRGKPIARELRRRIERRLDAEIELSDLKLKRYSDDLSLLHDRPKLEESELDVEIEDRPLLLVDDVLYSGQTLFRAAAYLNDLGPRSIHPAVLCSRGPNEVPIHADVVGLQLDVRPKNIIEVHAPPYEEEWGIRVRRKPED